MICKRCNEDRPATAFKPNRKGGRQRTTCHRCNKAALRRRKGARLRSEIVAKPRPVRNARSVALKQMRVLLGKLLEQKAGAVGLQPETVEYQVRYRTNPTFREKEIARTWARKAASGVGRTDGRTTVPMQTDGTLTPSVVAGLFAQARCCAYCHEPIHPRDKTLDHVVPVSKGGVHSIANVVIACKSCNSRKHARTPDQWLSADSGTNSGTVRHVA